MRILNFMKRASLVLLASGIFSATVMAAELARGIRPDQLGLAEVYSVLALRDGDLVAFGRDEILRGKLVLLPAAGGVSGLKTLVVLAAEEAAQIRRLEMAALGVFPLGPADQGLRAAVLLYQLDDSTPYWKQSEMKLEVLAFGADLISRTTAKRLGLTSEALKGADPQSRWVHPGGESEDSSLAEDPPGYLSRVAAGPLDIDGDGWSDLVVWVDECVSALKSATPSGLAATGCPAGFVRRPARALGLRFDPSKHEFGSPSLLSVSPSRTGAEIYVGETLEAPE